MQGVCAPCGMLHIVLSSEKPLGGEFHTRVIQKTIWVDHSIILRGRAGEGRGGQGGTVVMLQVHIFATK